MGGYDYFFYLRQRHETNKGHHLRAARYAQPFQRRTNYDAVISGAFKIPRLLPRTLIGLGHALHVGMCPHVRLSPGRCCRWHKRGKTATPNLRQIAHNPRTTAQFDKPFYTPIRRPQILGPIATHPKLKRIWRASHGIPFSLFGPVYR